MEVYDAILKTELFQAAKSNTLEELERISALKTYQKGSHLFFEKEEVPSIYIVISGMTSLYKINNLGEKKVVFVFGQGKVLNEVTIQSLVSSINCEVLEKATVLVIPRDRLLRIMEKDFGLTKAIIDSESLKIRRLYRQLKNTSNSIRGDKKIAAKLWKLSKDYGTPCDKGIRIDMELSITYLSYMLGSKRETVSRQLKVLAEKGLIINEKNHFIIPEPEDLKRFFKES